MAMLLQLQRACVSCGPVTPSSSIGDNSFDWASKSFDSESSSSGSCISTGQTLLGPPAATLRVRWSGWGQLDRIEDGKAWGKKKTVADPEKYYSSRSRSARSHCYFHHPLFLDEARRKQSSPLPPAVQPSFAKMNSQKDALLPISIPPSGATPREEQKSKSSRMTKRGGTVALSYMMCAVMLVMFNKTALSTYNFPCANVITVLQMACSTGLLYVLKKMDIITFASEGNGAMDLTRKGFVPLRLLKRASPLSTSYLFYMVVGMASIRGVNVPMYTTLRRTTVLFTMALELFLVGQKYSTPIVSSVGLIVLGAFIAGARDLSFDSNGYLIVLVSNLTTALYLSTISRLGKTTGLNSFGLMWCNGIICGPILLLWTILSGELGLALQFPAVFLPSFQLVIILSCMMAFCLNYTIFLNTSLNSPLTQTMCGNLKDLGTVLIGWLWFGGLPFDWLNVLGQFLGFLGSGLYAYCKLKGI